MPSKLVCRHCGSPNPPEASQCIECGRSLKASSDANPDGLNVLLQRIMGGEVYTAVVGGAGKRSTPSARALARTATDSEAAPTVAAETRIEDHSDVIAAALDRIRTKSTERGQRFKPYVRTVSRGAVTARGREEFSLQLDVGVALLRDRRFEEAIEPLLKAIARDDEDRRPWILLGEAYIRMERPYKAAVAYLRALELSPRDEQAWIGLGRVLRAIDELPAAAEVLDLAVQIHPEGADSWVERGMILEGMGKLPEALRSIERALEIRPDHRLGLAKHSEIQASVRNPGFSDPGSNGAEVEGVPPPTEDQVGEPASDFLEEMEESLAVEQAVTPSREIGRDENSVTLGPRASPERLERVRTFVEGLDETLEGGIPWGHLVLIEGAPGTMKSSLAFSILLHNAAYEGLNCLYLSLEERASSLLKQMGSLGLRLEVPKGSLVVLDPRTAADLLGDKADWVDALRSGIRSIKEKRGLDLIVIDSLEALEVLAKFKDRRREMYRLFEWLRDLGITSFVVTERPDWLIAGHVLQGRWDEDFLADGVIHLRMHMVSDLEAQRRLRVVKMRGAKHDTGYLAMVLDDGRFRVMRAMSP
jgi:KaiC/GvpD/RAD55 family RecA-like ATPase/Flp pilus assembly protein TadD